MSDSPHAPETVASVSAQLDEAVAQAVSVLRASGKPVERLGAYEPPRRRMFGTRAERIVPAGECWPLGVVVITPRNQIRAAGQTLRAHVPKPHFGYTAESQRERDALRHAAIRGGFAEGETVHWHTAPIDPAEITADSAPLCVRGDTVVVRWTAGADASTAPTLVDYLTERIDLLR